MSATRIESPVESRDEWEAMLVDLAVDQVRRCLEAGLRVLEDVPSSDARVLATRRQLRESLAGLPATP